MGSDSQGKEAAGGILKLPIHKYIPALGEKPGGQDVSFESESTDCHGILVQVVEGCFEFLNMHDLVIHAGGVFEELRTFSFS